jgi:serine protease AprX
MAKRHVIAYFMHETEKDAAVRRLTSAEVTDSFVIGDIEDDGIDALRREGVIVQEQLSTSELSEPPVAARSVRSAPRSVAGRSPAEFADAFPAALDYYIVKLNGPLIEAWRKQLDDANVRLLDALAEGGYKARLRTEQLAGLRALPFVQSITWISPEASVPKVMTRSVPGPNNRPPASGYNMLAFDVRLHDPNDRQKVEGWLNDRNVAIAGSSGRKIRIYVLEDSPVLGELPQLTEVDTLAEYKKPQLYNQFARRLLGIDGPPGSPPSTYVTQDGTDQIVAVADTGIDDQHPDFQGRIVGKIPRGRPNDTSDPEGHGTHVAGSILGDGAASGGQIKGIAPNAKLFFQSLLDANGELGGLPLDLNELFDEAYQAGARIHNNSWGADRQSSYTIDSEEVDEYVNSHKDMLIVIAAGNAGISGAVPKKADPGFVDWLSIGSPASCKNALTVGASRSDRTDGPMAAVTWGTGWPNAFPSPPIANESVSGDPDSLAAFSSRGPCDDHRIKPDVVAPGTDILSTKSSLAPISNYWGAYPTQSQVKDPHYAFDGGTSMATPLVAGCAALVRQYYTKDRQHLEPSAALLKATLVNSTEWLNGNDSTAKITGKPNFHQGNGRVCMNRAIPNVFRPGMALQFVDDWKTFQFTRTGQRKRYQFVLPAGAPDLRICMAYTDAPARGLQNNVNLMAQHLESGTKYLGNAELPDALTLPDPDNNVECVRIENPPAGTYFIQVFAGNLLKPPQDFALVVTCVGLPQLTEI